MKMKHGKDMEMGKSMRKMSASMPMKDVEGMIRSEGKHLTMPMPECKKMDGKMKNSHMK